MYLSLLCNSFWNHATCKHKIVITSQPEVDYVVIFNDVDSNICHVNKSLFKYLKCNNVVFFHSAIRGQILNSLDVKIKTIL